MLVKGATDGIHVDLSSEWLCGIPLRAIWQEVFSASIRKMHFENDILNILSNSPWELN